MTRPFSLSGVVARFRPEADKLQGGADNASCDTGTGTTGKVRLTDFEGHWRIDRVLTDHRDGRHGRLAGQAAFTRCAAGLRYAEDGVLRMDNAADLTARQSYIWVEDTAGLAVQFSDGRPFHRLETAAQHFCAPDAYRVQYEFSAWPQWMATWRVTGPRKDYTSVTHYVRAAV